MTLPLTIFLPAFYASTIGINLAVVGIVFMVVRLGDLFFDPFVGGLMDRTHSRWGRFKPWLAGGVPLIMVGAWLLFMAQPGVGPAYLAIALIICYAGYSIIILSQMGVGAALTANYRERARVFAWWQAFNTFGIILALVFAPALSLFFNVLPTLRIAVMGMCIIVLTPITVAIALFFVRDTERATTTQSARLADYLSLFRLRSTCLLLASALAIGLGLGCSSAVYVFFFATLKDIPVTLMSVLLAGMTLINLGAAPVWARIANLIDKHRALALGCLSYACYQTAVGFMPPGNIVFLIGTFIFGGFGACAADLLPRAMMADVADEDRFHTGSDRTGMLYALYALTIKLGQALAIGVVYTLLDLFGFKAAAGKANDHHALLCVLLLGSAVPATLYVLAAISAWLYPLTAKRHDAIRQELSRRHVPANALPASILSLEEGLAAGLPLIDQLPTE